MDECGCGRSPNGKCIGWHGLSEEEYQEKLKEYVENNKVTDQCLIVFYGPCKKTDRASITAGIGMKTAMSSGKPKVWDKQKRTYEIKWPDGKRELWKKVTIRECLTKYYNMGAQELGLEIREIVGKELKLQEIMDD